jgi:hypothetical protein
LSATRGDPVALNNADQKRDQGRNLQAVRDMVAATK